MPTAIPSTVPTSVPTSTTSTGTSTGTSTAMAAELMVALNLSAALCHPNRRHVGGSGLRSEVDAGTSPHHETLPLPPICRLSCRRRCRRCLGRK